ncbi:DUF4270 family protein [Flavobacterium seoulense]|uniref:DUF4270 domain-containing protein n=1 Tax=Flavobacterium seoulense TaxID=1492738 RepID=A0A066X145_9FLAO|nr:DUF4270 family protein [Flavobacterium seoulense]KDN56859.1 hypothetical protein FEM21_03620 [Flavobacterium seoulense]
MYRLFIVLFFGIILTSCDSDVDAGEFVVGSDNLSVNNKVILIDTATVEVSTINFDSLVTSSQSRILLGNYDDPIFGKVSSDSYFQLTSSGYNLQTTSSDLEGANYVFDSIRMVLIPDKYYYGDTTKVQSLSIHRLLQKVKPNSEDDSFYNNSSLSYDAASIGLASFMPHPVRQDSIFIKMDAIFGDALFQKLKKREITTEDEFVEYFKGIVIRSTSATTSCVMGYQVSSLLQLYYSKKVSDDKTSILKEFTISDISKQFNRISLDRTGTLLKDLPGTTGRLSSNLTENKSFIQSGTGLACRIDFPNIKQLKYITQKGAIVDAQLMIRPVNNTYSKSYPLADSLSVYVADQLNRIGGTLTSASGASIYAVLNKAQDEFDENIGYTIPLGTFMQNEMVKVSDSRSALILTIPNISKGVNRLVLGNQKNIGNKVQLKIYYISY